MLGVAVLAFLTHIQHFYDGILFPAIPGKIVLNYMCSKATFEVGLAEFTLTGNQGDYWVPAHVNVTSKDRYFVIIEAVVGSGLYGTLVISELNVYARFTQTVVKLSEKHICSFSQN